MYKWKVKITTKSGTVLKGIFECEHTNSANVAEKLLLRNNNEADFVGIYTEDCCGNLLFDTHEIAALELRPQEG